MFAFQYDLEKALLLECFIFLRIGKQNLEASGKRKYFSQKKQCTFLKHSGRGILNAQINMCIAVDFRF